MDVSIIIVSWNSEKDLKKCLSSVYSQTSEIDFEVIVVDNSSVDESARVVLNDFSQTKLIRNKENLGFATAVNQGIEASKGKYVLLLNPDTEILDRAIERMKDYMDEYPGIGVLGSKIVNPDGSIQPSIARFPKLSDQFLIVSKLHFLFPDAKSLILHRGRDLDYSQSQEVEQVMGAVFMIRREVIEKIGPLDPKFFIWMEEVDFCRRVNGLTDYQVFYYAQAKVVHTGGQSFAKIKSLRKQRWYLKSTLYYFKKHHQWLAYIVILLISPLSLFLAWIIQLFSNTKSGKEAVENNRKKRKKL